MYDSGISAVRICHGFFFLTLFRQCLVTQSLPCGGGIYDSVQKFAYTNTSAARRHISHDRNDTPATNHGYPSVACHSQSRLTRKNTGITGQESRDHTLCTVFLDGDASFAALWSTLPNAKLNMLSIMKSVNEIFKLQQNQDYIPIQFHVRGVNVNQRMNFTGTSASTTALLEYQRLLSEDCNATSPLIGERFLRQSWQPSPCQVCLNILFSATSHGDFAGVAFQASRSNSPFADGGMCDTSDSAGLPSNVVIVNAATVQGILSHRQIAIALAHELGHAVGATHDCGLEESVQNSANNIPPCSNDAPVPCANSSADGGLHLMYPLVGGISATTTATSVTANNVLFSQCSKVRAAAVIAERGTCLVQPTAVACVHPDACCSAHGVALSDGLHCLAGTHATVNGAQLSVTVGRCVDGACTVATVGASGVVERVNVSASPADGGIVTSYCAISPGTPTTCVQCSDELCALVRDKEITNMLETVSSTTSSAPAASPASCAEESVVGFCSAACGSGTRPIILTDSCTQHEYYAASDCVSVLCDTTAPRRVLLQLDVSPQEFSSTRLVVLANQVLGLRVQVAAVSIASEIQSSMLVQVSSCREIDPAEYNDCVPAATLRAWLRFSGNQSALSAALQYNYTVLTSLQAHNGHDAEVYGTFFAFTMALSAPVVGAFLGVCLSTLFTRRYAPGRSGGRGGHAVPTTPMGGTTELREHPDRSLGPVVHATAVHETQNDSPVPRPQNNPEPRPQRHHINRRDMSDDIGDAVGLARARSLEQGYTVGRSASASPPRGNRHRTQPPGSTTFGVARGYSAREVTAEMPRHGMSGVATAVSHDGAQSEENADKPGISTGRRRRSKSSSPRRPKRLGQNHPDRFGMAVVGGDMQRYHSLSPLLLASACSIEDVDGVLDGHGRDRERTYGLAGSPHRSTHKLQHAGGAVKEFERARESTV
eukprot:m.29113 g.29113  ORF g.29113 m.29113 type:complete len:942 (-) comp13678_c0_seq2:107-2932(-)